MIPVPGYDVGTPYGKRGPYWSCDEDAYGNGIHTGVDYPAPTGTPVVAARPGVARYCNHGAAFGYHQLDVVCDDGTRDFYAHMPSRAVDDGARVEAGQRVGKVGSEGNVTGPHLHFERHATTTGGWSCSVVRDPAPSINYQPASSGSGGAASEDEDMPKYSRTRLTKPLRPDPGAWTTLIWDTISNGDAGEQGEAYLRIAPSSYTATLTAKVSGASGGPIATRLVEREQDNAGHWQNAEEYPPVEHPLTTGDTFISDTRVQSVPKGRRLICQVKLDGGTVEAADWQCLYF